MLQGASRGAASLQEPMGSESEPEDLSVEELERHIRALQLEIARSDAAGAGGKALRGAPLCLSDTGGDEFFPMHASTPLPDERDSVSSRRRTLHLQASYSMRWTVLPESRQ